MVSNTELIHFIFLLQGSFEFSTETEKKEKVLLEAVKRLMGQLPAIDS